MGLICLHTGYPVAFALTAALILAAIPVAARERQAVIPGSPISQRAADNA